MPDPDPREAEKCIIANPIVTGDDYYIVLLTNSEYNGIQQRLVIDRVNFWNAVNTKPLSF
jgi:hypothetical protein